MLTQVTVEEALRAYADGGDICILRKRCSDKSDGYKQVTLDELFEGCIVLTDDEVTDSPRKDTKDDTNDAAADWEDDAGNNNVLEDDNAYKPASESKANSKEFTGSVIALHKGGWSVEKISEEKRVNKRSVIAVLNAAGLTPVSLRSQVEKLYDSGKSPAEIARALGVLNKRVYYLIGIIKKDRAKMTEKLPIMPDVAITQERTDNENQT